MGLSGNSKKMHHAKQEIEIQVKRLILLLVQMPNAMLVETQVINSPGLVL